MQEKPRTVVLCMYFVQTVLYDTIHTLYNVWTMCYSFISSHPPPPPYCVLVCMERVQALDEFTGGAEDARGQLEVFTPPERSVVAEMGPRGGAGPAPPLDGDSVDFVLALGGDGLLMYSNTLFRVRADPFLGCFFFFSCVTRNLLRIIFFCLLLLASYSVLFSRFSRWLYNTHKR